MTPPDWREMGRVFGRIGLLSFGGPAAQIALMHRELVEERPWLDEETYLRALSLCMLLPGPEAMQLATYAGWRMRGMAGGLLAGLLFVVPGAIVITLLAFLYLSYGGLPLVQAAFLGIKAAVIVVVIQALLKVSAKALKGRSGWMLAILSFLGLFLFGLPFPLIILAAGLWGLVTSRGARGSDRPLPALGRPVRTLVFWGVLWVLPLMLVWLFQAQFLLDLGLFFSKLAVVTFGGAYAVLAYMTQEVVQSYGWITTTQMIDALGLAETTPGPLILVTQFVALLAGDAQGGAALALTAGLLALWVTFVPCFLWIFLAGPYLERIAAQPRLVGALQAITAAVVGVIANLSIWFALHVLFGEVTPQAFLALPRPELASFEPVALGLTLLAALLMLRFRLDFILALPLLAIGGALTAFL
ncbi:MAG: chromate efflux transporter [Sulfitobacter sp.]|nr:chromate efflux transporter [Sulfitobacter sp.]